MTRFVFFALAVLAPLAFAQTGGPYLPPGSVQSASVPVPDSAVLQALDARLAAYFKTLEAEPVEVKNEECDFLIENTPEGPLRDHVAWTIYDAYLASHLMGDEGVSVHVADTWILPGKVGGRSEIDRINVRIFADFNRRSLLGMPAPELVLATPEDDPGQQAASGDAGLEAQRPLESTVKRDSLCVGGASDRYRVLFFYDTDCAKCKLEVVQLCNLLNENDFPLDVYAVYTGSDAEAWADWRATRMRLTASAARLFHGWDPEVRSDFQRKYAVLQTPRIFLIDPSGIIIGRGLDVTALQQLIDLVFAPQPYEYGGEEALGLFDRLVATYGDTLRTEDVLHIADLLRQRTLDRGDTLSFKHLEGDYLYWLAMRSEEVFRNGAVPFIREYVLSRPDIWNTADDSLHVVGLAEMMMDLLSRAAVGTKLPDMPIDGWKKLQRRGGYLLFFTEGCEVCEAELAAADSLRKAAPRCRRPVIVRVNVDEVLAEQPELANALFQDFDLSVLPNVLQIDRKGRVARKYMSLATAYGRIESR
ncbi:MAG: hypothetical protein GX125_02045 [Bacteroidales bacterium]|jgi:thiol-disulfide isomerase/thioredoxin|nr:thioredoxin family protein [Bacteroidota bacterium]NLN99040.1 hypothetical protein [Bacteroidales bacterium]